MHSHVRGDPDTARDELAHGRCKRVIGRGGRREIQCRFSSLFHSYFILIIFWFYSCSAILVLFDPAIFSLSLKEAGHRQRTPLFFPPPPRNFSLSSRSPPTTATTTTHNRSTTHPPRPPPSTFSLSRLDFLLHLPPPPPTPLQSPSSTSTIFPSIVRPPFLLSSPLSSPAPSHLPASPSAARRSSSSSRPPTSLLPHAPVSLACASRPTLPQEYVTPLPSAASACSRRCFLQGGVQLVFAFSLSPALQPHKTSTDTLFSRDRLTESPRVPTALLLT